MSEPCSPSLWSIRQHRRMSLPRAMTLTSIAKWRGLNYKCPLSRHEVGSRFKEVGRAGRGAAVQRETSNNYLGCVALNIVNK